jgi:hypothetical protein
LCWLTVEQQSIPALAIASGDGEDTKVGETTKLIIENVWNRKHLVALTVTGGKKVVVHSDDLFKAIKNSIDNDD